MNTNRFRIVGSVLFIRKHVHKFHIGSCAARQGGGCLGGLGTNDLSRDGRSTGRPDLQEPY